MLQDTSSSLSADIFPERASDTSSKRTLLSLRQACHACAFQRSGVDKGVLRTIFRLDEAKALAHVEEFYCSGNHLLPFQGASRKPHVVAARTAYIAHIVRRSQV
jgi:hypothetical protein